MSISANKVVSVTPGVLSAGGIGLVLSGMVLSQALALPIGAPVSFPTAAAVGNYFGPASIEKSIADVYFAGFVNGRITPQALLFSRYVEGAAVGAFTRGALNTQTLTQLKTIVAGTLSVTIDTVTYNIAAVNLAAATSFSNAATILQTAFTFGGTGHTVTYDAQFNAFVVKSGTTGATSTIGYVSGTVASTLGLLQSNGAVISQGSIPMIPGAAMDLIYGYTKNWFKFMNTIEPSLSDALLFATWNAAKAGQFAYVSWDSDVTAATTANNAATLGAQIIAAGIAGTVCVYNTPQVAAFNLGVAASIDFSGTSARITYAFKQSGLITPTVTDDVSAANLESNGYNYYGNFATANQQVNFYYPGSISGAYLWDDAHTNAQWLNSQLQVSILNGFVNTPSIPYNDSGYGLVSAFAAAPIIAAVNFGAIRPGVPLSPAQVQQVNQAAGTTISTVLQSRGWYFQVTPAPASARVTRSSPACTLWYMDGGSIQKLNVASIDVQ